MSNQLIGAIHRKSKSNKENKKDFYQTPTIVTKALIKGLWESDFIDMNRAHLYRVLDPCAGYGAITEEIKNSFKDVTAYDLYTEYGNRVDFLESEERFDLIFMNPPYSCKNKFIDKAMDLASGVFVLLPSNVENYNIMNKDYFDTEFYHGKIKTYPKLFMDQSLGDVNFGGTSTYSWHYFSKENKNHNTYKKEFMVDVRQFLEKDS